MTNPVMLNEGPIMGQAPADALRVKHEDVRAWVKKHTLQIDQYNEWAGQRETYSQRVHRWRVSLGPLGKAD